MNESPTNTIIPTETQNIQLPRGFEFSISEIENFELSESLDAKELLKLFKKASSTKEFIIAADPDSAMNKYNPNNITPEQYKAAMNRFEEFFTKNSNLLIKALTEAFDKKLRDYSGDTRKERKLKKFYELSLFVNNAPTEGLREVALDLFDNEAQRPIRLQILLMGVRNIPIDQQIKFLQAMKRVLPKGSRIIPLIEKRLEKLNQKSQSKAKEK